MLRVLTLSTLFPDATRPNFGIFVERQTLRLDRLGDVEVRVVAPVGVPPWPLSRLARFARAARLPLHERRDGIEVYRPRFLALPGTKGRFHARALEHAVVPLIDRMHRSWRFDVIDASFFFPDGPAAVALGRRYGVPVSIKARGADIHHWGRQRATARQVLAAARGADGLLAVSDAMAADMVALGMPAPLVHHTGVDLAAFAPRNIAAAKAALGVSGPLVVALGALIPRKGHEVVVRAVAALPGVTLLIAGEGGERGALERLIARLGVADRVRLLGSVAHGELPALLAAADVSALASSSEGLANAWIESLACGTPLVVTDAGGAAEVVTDADAGRIVARTPDAFAAAIAALLADPPERQAVRRHAARFTWTANATALHTHLSELVRARAGGG